MNPNAKTSEVPPPSCLLCGQSGASIVDAMRTEDLAVAWRQMGVTFSAEAWAVLEETSQVFRYNCNRCGFQFFDPSLAGNASFYAELQNQIQSYYPVTCPGFERAVKFALRHQLRSVLDIGCGSGAFLDLAKRAGLRTFGIELNPQGAAAAAAKGHQVYTCLMEDFHRQGNPDRFEMVTAFEVVEHVADPVNFLSQAAAFLKPTVGHVAISVPSRFGVARLCDENPHQWPPHHLSWWRLQDLSRLGECCCLKLVESGGDILLGGHIEHFANLRNEIRMALGKNIALGWKILPGMISFIYRKAGCKFFFPRRGASLYGFYKRSRG
jgi:SAM-dependent methyltransferase